MKLLLPACKAANCSVLYNSTSVAVVVAGWSKAPFPSPLRSCSYSTGLPFLRSHRTPRTVRTASASTTDVSSSFPTSSTKPDRRRCPDEPLRAHVRISWTMNCLGPLYHLHAIWTSQLNIKETRARPTGRQASMHHAASRSHILDIYHPHFSARMQLHRMN